MRGFYNKKTCIIAFSIPAVFFMCVALAAWLEYRDLKRAFVARVSDTMTAVIGQKVRIGDIYAGLPPALRLDNITIENPDGFPPGRLLRIKELRLTMKLQDLLRGRFRLGRIVISSPELTLVKDRDGRLNLSDGLRGFLSKKSSRDYQVDDLKIESGTLTFQGDGQYGVSGIELAVEKLSSRPGTKTLVRGSVSPGSGEKVSVDGWAYLNDERKKFRLSLSSGKLALERFGKFLSRLGIDPKAAKAAATVELEGDAGKGFSIKSEVRVTQAGVLFFRDEKKDVSLNADAFFSVPGRAVSIRAMTVRVGENTSVRVQGTLKDLSGNPSYDAAVRIEGLDLSALKLSGGRDIGGTLTSDDIHIRGDGKKGVSGKCAFVIKEPRYGRYSLARLAVSSGIDYREGALVLTWPKIDTGNFKANARRVSLTRSGKEDFSLDVSQAEAFGGRLDLAARGRASGTPFPLSVRMQAEDIDLGGISKTLSGSFRMPYSFTGEVRKASFEGRLDSADSLYGRASADIRKVSLTNAAAKRDMVKNAALRAQATFDGRAAAFSADAGAGDMALRTSGTAHDLMTKGRSIRAKVTLPEIKAEKIRESLWDIFPDRFLYTGLGGSLASEIAVDYTGSGLALTGNIRLKDLLVRGENSEYAAGPINGTLPVAYRSGGAAQRPVEIPAFDRSEFENLVGLYSGEPPRDGSSEITIGAFEYGFRLMDDIRLRVKQQGRTLHIGKFSANIFEGKLLGSAVVDISEGLPYRAGILVKGFSMAKMCDSIEPIRGYISGKIDGIASLKGSGGGMSGLIGKADFWTYAAKNEKMKISREFLQKVGGPSVKTYLRDRPFDKGTMSLYIKDGFVIFSELEISNRNIFGIRDLSVKVAPFNNRIGIDHLMWSMIEAAQRAKAKQ